MNDPNADAFDELERMQELIAMKLAEIGIVLQAPVSFAKHPSGARIVQLAGIWEDTSPVAAAAEVDDEFMSIIEGNKEAEAEERARAEEEARIQAARHLDDLSNLFGDDDE